MPRLLVISAAPATTVDGALFLDKKFVEGMRFYADLWDGPVRCLLAKRDDTFAFGEIVQAEHLPFTVAFAPSGRKLAAADIAGHDVVFCSGDDHEYLHLADACRANGQKIVYTIEYIAETRAQIIFLDPARSVPKKLYSLLWMLNQERRRRRAFRSADGLQANGYPAFAAYGAMNRNAMMYLDNRVSDGLLATEAEMGARHRRLLDGGKLRLIHSGRLEPMKGAQDLVPVARLLVESGIDFTLDIFGGGSVEPQIRAGVGQFGLQDRVRLHGVVDFATELVPYARAQADVYLSCHRQSDPSCTYIESMGCGLAVVGYANRMWPPLRRASGAGWAVPMGDVRALAEAVAEAASDRERLAACCRAAWGFAAAHSFEREFQRRVGHLETLSGSDRDG